MTDSPGLLRHNLLPVLDYSLEELMQHIHHHGTMDVGVGMVPCSGLLPKCS
jgi:hypothetical protein